MVLAALLLTILFGGVQLEFSGPKANRPAVQEEVEQFKPQEFHRQWLLMQKEHSLEILVVFAAMLVIFLLFIVLQCIFFIFVGTPMTIGCKKFFYQNLEKTASLRILMEPFEQHYLNGVRIVFMKNLRIFLWSLLFIIPGIIKSYEYSMVPYLIAEEPDLEMEKAFSISRQMMLGSKWRSFVLDLSFLGWKLLSVFTLGILYIFYVDPYVHQTHAALYEQLKKQYLTETYGKDL